jgi:hypothetical protein
MTLRKAPETLDQQMKDSNLVYNQITLAGIKTYKEAERMIVYLYVPDISISRAGISHALKRLEKFYSERTGNHSTKEAASQP